VPNKPNKPNKENVGHSADTPLPNLQAGKRTVYQLVTEKKISAFEVGGAWRFARADIDHRFKQQRTASRR